MTIDDLQEIVDLGEDSSRQFHADELPTKAGIEKVHRKIADGFSQ